MDYIALGRNIRNFRKIRMITQETLAEMCYITPVFVSQIENGARKPSLETVCSIANALEVTVDELLNTQENNKRSFDDFSLLLNERTEDEIRFSYDILKTVLEKMENGKLKQ